MLLLVSFVFSKQEAEDEEYFVPHVIFLAMQLYTFRHVFHHNVIRSQCVRVAVFSAGQLSTLAVVRDVYYSGL